MGIVIKENSLITQDTEDDSNERIKKEQEYLDYIKDHINNVKKAYKLYMTPLLKMNNISTLVSDEELKKSIIKLFPLIDTHDASKFSDSEFDGYRRKWYQTKAEEAKEKEDINYKQLVEDRYEECWQHHYKTNMHHPKYWYNSETKTSTDMSLDAIIEMLCDWESMSLKFGTSTLEWYKNDAKDEKEVLSPKTKEIVEDLLYNVLHNTVSE